MTEGSDDNHLSPGDAVIVRGYSTSTRMVVVAADHPRLIDLQSPNAPRSGSIGMRAN